MAENDCPICADHNYLDAFTKGRARKATLPLPRWRRQDKFWKPEIQARQEHAATVDAEHRGNLLRVVFDEENFDERWKDFTVEVFGVESTGIPMLPRNSEGVMLMPPGPLFFLVSFFPKGSQAAHFYQFFVCRVKHQASDLSLVSHWWPSHGRRVSLQSSLAPSPVNGDLDVIKDALDFFQKETRGGQEKFTEEMISDVLGMLGPHAKQKAAALALQVTETTLKRWRTRHGMSAWRDVVNRYGQTHHRGSERRQSRFYK